MNSGKNPRSENNQPGAPRPSATGFGGYRFAAPGAGKPLHGDDAHRTPQKEEQVDHSAAAEHGDQGPPAPQSDEVEKPRSPSPFPRPEVSQLERPVNRSREARRRYDIAVPHQHQPQTTAPIALVTPPHVPQPSPPPIATSQAMTPTTMTTPLPVKLGFDVKTASGMAPRTPSDFADREERLPCSFPGLLRILIPEKSFTPYTLAVRVANISVTGAMVEIHDRTKLPMDIAMANRFFELKVAHGEIPHMRGIIVWSDLKRANPMLGVSCFEHFTELGKVFKQEAEVGNPLKMGAPKLDPYPPKTKEAVLKLSGEAPPEATEVIAKGDEKKFRAPVEGGRFSVEIELLPNRENHFSVRVQAGVNKSRAIPVRIFREQTDTAFRCEVKMVERAAGGKVVLADFSGNVRQAELLLFRLSQLLANAERVTLTTKLESQTGFDSTLFDALDSDARMLAETDDSSMHNRLPTPDT
ncbi:MAG TPA: hypothetical protein PK988_05190, partial [Candidatus Sumerlaeota bacterium]|nr:hypothetical protein [Candidatus Sumerlaeota bacterium]